MPCTQLFDEQGDEYRRQVLPSERVHALAIEAGVTHGWWRYVLSQGDVLGLDRFGRGHWGSVRAAAVLLDVCLIRLARIILCRRGR